MLVGGVSARECDVPSLSMSPISIWAGPVPPLLSLMLRGSCSIHVPVPKVARGFPPCAFVSPHRGPSLGWEAA